MVNRALCIAACLMMLSAAARAQYEKETRKHFSRGMEYFRQGVYDKAIKEFKTVVEIDPTFVNVYLYLGVALFKQGVFDEAVWALKEAVEFNPQDEVAHNNLGVVYGVMGFREQEIAHYRRALSINPQYEEAQRNLERALEAASKAKEKEPDSEEESPASKEPERKLVKFRGKTITIRKAAPFALFDLEGKRRKLADFRGKVLILSFFSTWCQPCEAAMAFFKELHQRYGGQGLQVVAIALDHEEESVVRKFVEKNGISFTVLLGTLKVMRSYGGIIGIPTTFIIDADGYVYDRYVGYKDGRAFEDAIKPLLRSQAR